jgi:hypothetical protein
MAGFIAIFAVAALLVGTVLRQAGQAGPRGQLLSAIAILPQWKFFGESRLRAHEDAHDDLHLVARDWMGEHLVGPWQPALSPSERQWTHTFWNPSLRPDGMLFSFADDLAGRDPSAQERVTTSLAYLVLLRHCLDAAPPSSGARARQFAIVRTRGRGQRELSVAFLSHWHQW